MGLFSKVGGILGGGKSGSSNSSSSSASGYSILPQFAKDTLAKLDTGINSITPNQFVPLGVTNDEQIAFDRIRQGFAPTQESLNADIAMQQNPFDRYVIDEINRQSQGPNSVLQQNLNTAGQFGSNRQKLGANDIDLSRLNQIGGLLQSQFSNSLNNALTVLPSLRANDTQGLIDIGNFDRGMYAENMLAPINALNAQTGLAQQLGYTVGGSTSTSNSSSKQSESGGLFSGLGKLGSLASGVSSIAGLFSDERLKHNIEPYGVENGHKTYSYSYKGSDDRFIGVMAQDVVKYMPQAVQSVDGYLSVNYDMIGVNFREAA